MPTDLPGTTVTAGTGTSAAGTSAAETPSAAGPAGVGTVDVDAAHRFIRANARLLDLHVHAALFDGGPPGPVVAALAPYQNPDGGFGHGLEPDTRSPHSQPLDVEVALARLLEVGAGTDPRARDMARRACDFLATVAGPGGGVPLLLPSIEGHPMASHWVGAAPMPPALNPTASIAGLGHALGIRHHWLDDATRWCFEALEAGDIPGDAHTYITVARFLDHVPDRDRAERLAPEMAKGVVGSALFQLDPDPDNYGVTPLQVAPTPSGPARAWFTDGVVDAHLRVLAAGQQPDGGWAIRWQPPGEAGVIEWRGIVTLDALTTLRAYDRL